MAGRGSRFSEAGYLNPKPLIDIAGKTMIEIVIKNLQPDTDHRFIFICQKEHLEKYELEKEFSRSCNDYVVIGIDGITEGAACTVLKAKKYINSEDQLMIANCDQWIDEDINRYLQEQPLESGGLVMTMKANDPKWSFVSYNHDKIITRIVEKEVISDEATVGIYNFSSGEDFVLCAEEMIAANDRVNGEFYVAPVYNYLIRKGYKVRFYNIGEERSGMYGLGIPADLDYFLNSNVLSKALS